MTATLIKRPVFCQHCEEPTGELWDYDPGINRRSPVASCSGCSRPSDFERDEEVELDDDDWGIRCERCGEREFVLIRTVEIVSSPQEYEDSELYFDPASESVEDDEVYCRNCSRPYHGTYQIQ